MYQHIFFERFKDDIKHIDLENQIHDMILRIPKDYQHTLLFYLRDNFPSRKMSKEKFETEIAEIDKLIHEISNEHLDMIHDTIESRFPAASTNYEVSTYKIYR